MHVEPTQTVASLATALPHSVRVLERHHIDYCCGGERSLEEACARAGLAVEALVQEIEEDRPRPDDTDWTARPLSDLVDFIVVHYHRGLQEELPRLQKLAEKVALVHGAKDPARFDALLGAFGTLHAELLQHMEKEEQVLFPWIRAGQGPNTAGPIEVMRMEHDDAGDLLDQLRELTGDYVVPEGACGSWRALWTGLEALERDLHAHIHLENNVLFPRALDGR